MVKLTIDNHPIEVPAGATILDAARTLGITIPTLCKIDGLPPLTSCFVCVVAVEGVGAKLLPSCATPVRDGLVVHTDTPEVLAARKTAVELLLSDHLGECEAPCELACPAGFHIPQFLDHLQAGRLDEATALAQDDLVLPATLGRICPRFCENACRRHDRDQSVAIADLHRHAAERAIQAELAKPAALAVAPDAATIAAKTGKKVGIVGSGPAGLAAAWVLLKRGHACTLIDSAPSPGGLMRCSFDAAVLPAIVLDGEIATLRRQGAQFRLNTTLGREVTLADLRQEFDAVLLATGAPLWHKLDCPGGELGRSAGTVLADLGANRTVDVDCDVIIVGFGQEAVETAMTVRRRQGSHASVTVVSSRAASHMPLLVRQIEKAQSLGVKFHFEATVTEVRQPAVRYYLVVNAPAGPAKLDGQLLINATGRGPDMELLSGQGLQVGPRGVQADRATFATSLPGVFAAGEVVSGVGFAVRSIAQGREAAESIDLFLRGQPVAAPAHRHCVRYGKLSDEEHAMLLARTVNTGGRTPRVLDDKLAKSEADRCLDCGCRDNLKCRLRQAATLVAASSGRFKGDRRALERDASHPLVNYESNKCIMCGACVAICEQARAQVGLTYVGRGFNVRVAVPWGGQLADALGDLAARCAEACPTSAIVLKSASR